MAGVLKAEGVVLGSVTDMSRIDVANLHAEHADFLWASLYRLGVREADLPDMLQEVFVVVHRRRDSWDGSSRIRSWLFGIALRVVKNYRRKAYRRRERVVAALPEEHLRDTSDDPEQALSRCRAEQQARELLEELDPDKRAVFVMFEVEGIACSDIGDALGIPLGTVYSRLHAARKQFTGLLHRMRAREAATP